MQSACIGRIQYETRFGLEMDVFIALVLMLTAIIVAIPVAVFAVEIIVAPELLSSPAPSRCRNRELSARLAVLVPAHNESAGLIPTLSDIKQQLRPGDRLIVIADNCSDNTAAVALANGAEVIERHEPARRGKGYALDFGLQHLCVEVPDILIVVDADNRLAESTIATLTRTCATTRRPVQALDLMTAPAGSQINYQVSEFAWRVRNWLRPSGLAALRMPCQLMGTGMAFPWDVICNVNLATGSIVEDLKLGLELTASGYPPLFCPSALVTSQFALSARGARSQRERWERGHLYTIVTTFPQLLCRAVLSRDWKLLALTLDLAVPPLSFLAILVAGIFGTAGLYRILGYSSVPLAVSSVTLVGFILAACIAWLKCGRDVLPLRAVLLIAPYIVRKIGLYGLSLFHKGDMRWVRTHRDKSE